MEGDNIYSQNIYNNFNIQQQLLLLNLFVCPNFAEEKYLKKFLSVVRCENIFHTFVMQGVILRQADIFYESVFIVLDKKSGKFQWSKDGEQHSFLV